MNYGPIHTTDLTGVPDPLPDDVSVLDVREDVEWQHGHIPGAVHIPMMQLPGRLAEVPADRPVWVHCAVGYRASIAVSLLARAGREVVLIDDDLRAAPAAGLPMEEEAAVAGR
jgi:rhodanese-related sulfurtransferase